MHTCLKKPPVPANRTRVKGKAGRHSGCRRDRQAQHTRRLPDPAWAIHLLCSLSLGLWSFEVSHFLTVSFRPAWISWLFSLSAGVMAGATEPTWTLNWSLELSGWCAVVLSVKGGEVAQLVKHWEEGLGEAWELSGVRETMPEVVHACKSSP